MNRQAWFACSSLLCLVSVTAAYAVEPHTEHTFRLAEGDARPAATLEDAAWLAGRWTGTAFGKRFEEVWNPPSGDSMLGMWKSYGDNGDSFYELMLLTVEDGTLSLKVKHFSPEFVAWEDKADFVDFWLVAKEDGALHFGGISFYRRGDDAMDGYIVMRDGEEISEQKLEYRRVANDR